ncbi:MAG: DNA recombination protein RmuC [Sedimentisphaerales bacterium]|nr:DNA recombination protein RmuC [Sedimentisphaerales bacterium]
MLETLIIIAIVLLAVVACLLVWVLASDFKSSKEISGQSASIGMLQQQLEALKSAQDGARNSFNQTLHTSQLTISRNLDTSQKVLGQLNSQIGELQGTNKQMLQLGTDVKRLQEILARPKMRGQLGEWSLANLLQNVLPADSYQLQYGFRDGQKVDALVKLAEHSVPVDAKFPLPAFEALVKAETDEERAKLRKQFHNDVIKHIDKISSNYIRPAEGTLDFALMFIPAENIYYETVVKYTDDAKDIIQYTLDKKVIPVSPNLLYAYLMTVVMGLQGLQIEKQAAEIRQNLSKLNASFAGFLGDWDTLGTHIRNSYTKYEQGQKTLDRFGIQLEQIQTKENPQ